LTALVTLSVGATKTAGTALATPGDDPVRVEDMPERQSDGSGEWLPPVGEQVVQLRRQRDGEFVPDRVPHREHRAP